MGGEGEGEMGGSGIRVTWTAETLGGNNLGGGLGAAAGVGAAAAAGAGGVSYGLRVIAVDSSEAERAYRCMRWVCGAVWKEVHRDIRIHNTHVFPR